MSDVRPDSTGSGLRLITGVWEGLRIAMDSLGANLFRAALTILGVAIGVAVVVIMAALITGIRSTVQEGIEAAGPRNFFVTRFDLTDVQLISDGNGRPSWWNRPSVSIEEASRAAALPAIQNAVLSVQLQDPGSRGWDHNRVRWDPNHGGHGCGRIGRVARVSTGGVRRGPKLRGNRSGGGA